MKIINIVGSMRKGNSFYIATEIEKKINNVSTHILGGDINYCTGCLECDNTHKCIINDRMDIILDDVISSDIIIMITPVRYSLVSGDIKVFIDRLNPTAVSEELVGKKLIAIAVGQTTKEDGTIEDALKSIEMFTNNAGIEYLGGYGFYECYGENEVSNKTKELEKMMEWLEGLIG